MTADRDGPASDRDADASHCDSRGAEPGSLHAAGKDRPMRSSGHIELLRRSPGGYVASSHRQSAMHRPRRALGRSHRGLPTVPRVIRDARTGHVAEQRLDRAAQASPGEPDQRRFVARALARAVRAVRSPYLGNIGVLILLFVISYQPCFDLANAVSNSVLCLGAKTAFAATVNLVVDEWTPTIQAFLAGRLLRWIGLSLLLALLPALTIIRAGMLAKLRSFAALSLARLRGIPRNSLWPQKQGRGARAIHEKVNTPGRYDA